VVKRKNILKRYLLNRRYGDIVDTGDIVLNTEDILLNQDFLNQENSFQFIK